LKLARGEAQVDQLSSVPEFSIAQRSFSISLPLPQTPLVGRAYDVAGAVQLLRQPDCRLLTLTGLGGVGKTRVAIQVARDVREQFADGVYFIPLAPITSLDYIVPAIAAAIGYTFQGAIDPKTQLLNHLREKDRLLVLDNFEHLIDGATLLTEICQAASQVKLLITSRERLDLSSEWPFDIQALPFPEDDHDPNLEDYSAVQMFVQSVRRVAPDFRFAVDERLAVARICRLVEGLPLAIELATAWARVLSCSDIAREIERDIGFLTSAARDMPERHRSLRAVFDHSWRLLAEDERNALAGLSVFRGGFSREAAQAVVGASLRQLSALVDQSWLRHTETGRYDLHELVRQYAATQLATQPDVETAVHDRHCAYYTGLLQQRERALKSAQQTHAVAELLAEIDNIRSAWDWATIHVQSDRIRYAVESLWWFYEIRGWYNEGAGAFQRAIDALRPAGDAATATGRSVDQEIALAHAIGKSGILLLRAGRQAVARDMMAESVALLRPNGDQRALAYGLRQLASANYMLGDFAEASRLLHDSIDLARSIGDTWGTAFALTHLGIVTQFQGDSQSAYQIFREGLQLWRACGDPRGISFDLNFASNTARTLGLLAEARDLLGEGLALAQTINDRWAVSQSLYHLGLVAQALGENVEAETQLRESVRLMRELGDLWSLARILNSLAATMQMKGEQLEAEQNYHLALRTALDAKVAPIALDALVGLADLRSKQGAPEAAWQLAAHVLQHSAGSKETKDRAERLRVELESQLTAQQIEAARARAQMKTLEQVVDEVLRA